MQRGLPRSSPTVLRGICPCQCRMVSRTRDRVLQPACLQLTSQYGKYTHTHVCPGDTRINISVFGQVDLVIVDAPEGESLGFADSVEAFKHLSGPAHLKGNPIISSECGAIRKAAYSQTLGSLLYSVHRGLAGGVSMNVFHGYPYSGPFTNTTWPGVTIFGWMFTEMWTPRQPAWGFFPAFMNYVSRNQLLLQTGVPKVDLAFYAYRSPWVVQDGYQHPNLQQKGYTYEYIGPSSLTSDEAVVEDGRLAPEGPAYKALVFYNQTVISPAAAVQLRHFARDGLPLVFVGSRNLTSIGAREGDDARVEAVMHELHTGNLENVFFVQSADALPAVLEKIGLRPNTALTADADGWYSFRRSSEDGDLVWLYNDGEEEDKTRSPVEVVFSNTATQTPFILDAWSGDVIPAVQYERVDDDIVMPVSLTANGTTTRFFKEHTSGLSLPTPPDLSVTSISGSVADVFYRPGSHPRISASLLSGAANISLSSGNSKHFQATPPEKTALEKWNLEIEDWHRGQDPHNVSTVKETHRYANVSLAPWSEIDRALSNVSGRGIYTAQFSIPTVSAGRTLGARLHLGPVKDTARVYLDDNVLPALILSHEEDVLVDLTRYLLDGVNSTELMQLKVELASTLFNRIQSEVNITKSMAVPPNIAQPIYEEDPPEQYGLEGPVWIEWVEVVDVV